MHLHTLCRLQLHSINRIKPQVCVKPNIPDCSHDHLFVMLAGPLDLLQQVSEVRPDGDVVLPWPELIVEMLVVAGLLL